jgi:AMMECR1 domain-containing protein
LNGQEKQPEAKSAQMNTNPLIPSLKLTELESVHRTACKLVKAAVNHETIDACQELDQLAALKVSGVFVTLKRGNTLRGCCGMLGPYLIRGSG